MEGRGSNWRENRGKLRKKGDVQYSVGSVNGMPIYRAEGQGGKVRVVESEERLMAHNWQRGRMCEAD